MRGTTVTKGKMNYFGLFSQQRTWAPLAQGAAGRQIFYFLCIPPVSVLCFSLSEREHQSIAKILFKVARVLAFSSPFTSMSEPIPV